MKHDGLLPKFHKRAIQKIVNKLQKVKELDTKPNKFYLAVSIHILETPSLETSMNYFLMAGPVFYLLLFGSLALHPSAL